MLIVVDFPAPLGPRKPNVSPARDDEVDAPHRFHLAVALDQAVHRTTGGCRRRRPRRRRSRARDLPDGVAAVSGLEPGTLAALLSPSLVARVALGTRRRRGSGRGRGGCAPAPRTPARSGFRCRSASPARTRTSPHAPLGRARTCLADVLAHRSHGAGCSLPRSCSSSRPASVIANSLRPSISCELISPSSSSCCSAGIHRAGAGTPDPLAALLHLLHDLVAVARFLGEQQQRRGADVPAPRPSSTSATAAADHLRGSLQTGPPCHRRPSRGQTSLPAGADARARRGHHRVRLPVRRFRGLLRVRLRGRRWPARAR